MKKYQVIFLDYDDDKFPYTVEYFISKKEAENWADEHEFNYWDEAWSSVKQDYVYQQFFRYHNPQDGQVYHGYEIEEIPENKVSESIISDQSASNLKLKDIIKKDIVKMSYKKQK